MRMPSGRSASTTAVTRSVSLTRSSAAPRIMVVPRAMPATSASSGSSSTSRGTSAAVTRAATSSAERDLQVAGRLGAGPAAVQDVEPRAHAAEHVEEAGARRVQPEVVDGQVGAREQAWRRR